MVCPPNAGKERQSMSKRTGNSLFIVSSMPRLYQHLLKGTVSFEHLGGRITRRIRQAHAFRQIEQVRELSELLLSIPIKEYQLIANYYLVWCEYRESKYDTKALESIIEQTRTYKAKALFSRGAAEWHQENSEVAFSCY